MKKFYLDRRKIKIPTNPEFSFAKVMVEEARGFDEVISIGGGSTIDVGKLIALELNIPHIAVPTTAGTGSEVTKYAVFIDSDGKKFSLEDDKLIPTSYLLIPSLLVTLPREQTVATGLDALCQSIESYWSPYSTEESRGYSKQAIDKVMNYLEASCNEPKNIVYRREMLEAANLSGRAINITRTSVCHAISYALTEYYKIPHGIACAMTLPFFMEFNEFTYILPKEVETLLKRLNTSSQVPKNLINPEFIARKSINQSRLKNNFKEVRLEDIINSLLPWTK